MVRFVGNVVRDADCAQLLANAGLPNTLIELITAKQVNYHILTKIYTRTIEFNFSNYIHHHVKFNLTSLFLLEQFLS